MVYSDIIRFRLNKDNCELCPNCRVPTFRVRSIKHLHKLKERLEKT